MSAMFATRRRRGWTLFGVVVLAAVLLALRQLTGKATSADSARAETVTVALIAALLPIVALASVTCDVLWRARRVARTAALLTARKLAALPTSRLARIDLRSWAVDAGDVGPDAIAGDGDGDGVGSLRLTGVHLLFIVNVDWFFLSHRAHLVTRARAEGARVSVWCGDTGRGDEIRALGAEYRALPLSRKGLNPLAEVRLLAILLWRVWRLKPDLVQNVSIKPVLYGTLAARLARRPVVNAVSGFGYALEGAEHNGWLRRLLLAAYRMVLRSPQVRVVFQNPDAVAFFVSKKLIRHEQATEIRGSGVDLSEFRCAPQPADPRPIVAFVGRMLWDKGLREFVDTAARLRSSHPDARFVLVGAPDPENRATASESYLRGAEASGAVEWWGTRTDVATIMAASSLVVLPSYHEGLPKVLLEAAAVGRAVVATDIAGCRAVVEHGCTGLLVPPRDTDALADAVDELLRSPAQRRAMGSAASARVRVGFDIEHVQEAFVALWTSSLCGGHPPTGQGSSRVRSGDHGASVQVGHQAGAARSAASSQAYA